MNRKELEFAVEDITHLGFCIVCGLPLKNHTDADLKKCYDDIINAEEESEKYEQ